MQNVSSLLPQNCNDDTEETSTLPFTPVPPPLIPISLLGSSQNNKFSLPKIPKLSRPETQQPSSHSSKEPKNSKDYFNAHEIMSSLPAQNLAVMNGKKYIVIPKDNAMAVQPAITAKTEMNRERARWDRMKAVEQEAKRGREEKNEAKEAMETNVEDNVEKEKDEVVERLEVAKAKEVGKVSR